MVFKYQTKRLFNICYSICYDSLSLCCLGKVMKAFQFLSVT